MPKAWDQRYQTRSGSLAPEPGVASLCPFAAVVPLGARAMDVAGGAGRHVALLRERGWTPLLVDGSAVALKQAAERVPGLETTQIDLEQHPLPQGPFGLILMSNYYQPALFAACIERLSPGGQLLFVQPTTLNLQRHPRPSARFLVEPERLRGLMAGLEVLHCSAGWREDGRHVGWVLGRRAG